MPSSDFSALRSEREGGPSLQVRLDELRALIPELPGSSEESGIEQLCLGLLDLLERKQRHLIQGNVRLAALRELTESLLRDPEEERVLRTISLYLRQAHGLAEVVVLSRGEEGGVRGYRTRSGSRGLCEAVRWSAETIRGTVWERALAGESILAARPEDQPPGTPAPLPIVLPIQTTTHQHEIEEPSSSESTPTIGILAIRPDAGTGAGSDPLEVEQLAFQVATLLESVRHQQQTIQDRRFRECLMETMEDGLLAVDRSGRVSTANRAALSLLGLGEETIVGRPLEELRGRAAEVVEVCLLCVRDHTAVRHQEAWIRGENSKYPVSLSVAPLGENSQEEGGVVATMSDLRPLREMEEELRRLDRLAALGRFAAAVAHEIRNPLAAIGAGVDFLAKELGEEKQSDLNLLRSEIDRLDRIVADLLEPARTQPLQVKKVMAARIVQRACQTVEPLARERGVQFAVHPPVEEAFHPLVLQVDRDRLLQVLVNLVRNAAEASPRGGTIEIGWDKDRAETRPTVILWVRDHGSGIAPEHLEHLFEPFYSTKAGGTGLGLYVSRSVVEQHGGKLQVEPAPGGGTRATVQLPQPSE